MRKTILLVSALAVTAVATQAVAAMPPPGQAKKNVVASATGAGHTTQGEARRTFAFSAREHANGTDRGQAQLRDRSVTPHLRVHVRITCLNVVGDMAHMTGVVSRVKTESATVVQGTRVAFSVQDNGATGDLVSPMTFHGTGAALDCTASTTAPTLLVQRGQVKVRP